MKKHLTLVLITVLLAVSGCAPARYNVIVAPKKTAEENKVATAYAERIYSAYHARGMERLRKELVDPDNRHMITKMVTDKIDNSSLGECLTNHGFGDYLSQRMLKDVTIEKLHKQIVTMWVSQYPIEMLKKVDQTVSAPLYKKIRNRMLDTPGSGDIREKLKQLRSDGFITEAEANEFLLTTEDVEIKSFMIIANHDIKRASQALLVPYTNNPSSVILDFMKINSAASSQCSFVEGSPL